MSRKRYNPNTALGRRKLREQNESWLQSLTPEQAEAWQSYTTPEEEEENKTERFGFIKAAAFIFTVGWILSLLLANKELIRWLHYLFS